MNWTTSQNSFREFISRTGISKVAREIAHSIELANQLEPSKWGLRVGPNDLMLKVGSVETLQAGVGWFHLLLDKSHIPKRILRYHEYDFSPNEPYKSAPGCITCNVGTTFSHRAYHALLRAHEAAIRIVSGSRRHPSTVKDHSARFVNLLSNEIGRSLPQPSFVRVNRIRNKELTEFASEIGVSPQFTDLCAYTIKHSSDLETFADGHEHTLETGGTIWAGIVKLLAAKELGKTMPVLFAPAERVAKVTAFGELVQVRTAKSDGVNSFTFKNFQYLSPPIVKSLLVRETGKRLGNYRRAYAICFTPKDLAQRLVAAPTAEAHDIAEIDRDETIPDETTREELRQARRGQGAFRRKLDKFWGLSCAVTNCGLRDLLRASHIKPWAESDNEERLDPDNGILLLSNIDILFEKGFVSFDGRGQMLISPRLSAADRRLLLVTKSLRRKPSARQQSYLASHRKAFGFPD